MTNPTQPQAAPQKPQFKPDVAIRMYAALKRIAQYQSVEGLRRYAARDYGLDADEAIEYAYENVISEAKAAIRGVRLPKVKP